MQIAIVGLAGSGKTTVFNTLTRGHAQTGGYGGMEAARRHGQGPRRAAGPSGRDLQAQEDRPGGRDLLRSCRRRRLRAKAGSGPKNCRPTSWPDCAKPTPCCTSCGPSRIAAVPHADGFGRRLARPGAARPRIHPGGPVGDGEADRAAQGQRPPRHRRPSATPTTASWRCWSGCTGRWSDGPAAARRERSRPRKRSRSAASAS